MHFLWGQKFALIKTFQRQRVEYGLVKRGGLYLVALLFLAAGMAPVVTWSYMRNTTPIDFITTWGLNFLVLICCATALKLSLFHY